MCETLSAEDLAKLGELVTQAIDNLKNEDDKGKRVDITRAEDLAARCRLLIEHYSEFSDEEKALVVGAVRYFVLPDDPVSDEDFATGLDDDTQIMNHVLEQLGIEGMFIEL